ncbi:CatA-like O-acetyltransferase [Mariniplasma anaerobium]|nr:CatA-like O-acetyltransferase [Mariniplasma anaerobium]
MKKIDMNHWERKEMYDFFKLYDLPRYQVTVDIDVTNLHRFVKEKNLSFYFSMMWVVMNELNQIENFKYRIENDDVYLFDQVHPSFTDLIENTNKFKIVNTLFDEDIENFVQCAKSKSKLQKNKFIVYDEEIRQDLVYITVFPWATYTHVTQATQINSKDAIPRILWGKYRVVNDRIIMPLTIEAHHSFVDGYHMGLLINKIEEKIEKL